MSEMGFIHYTLITILKGDNIAILVPKMGLRLEKLSDLPLVILLSHCGIEIETQAIWPLACTLNPHAHCLLLTYNLLNVFTLKWSFLGSLKNDSDGGREEQALGATKQLPWTLEP